MRKEFEMSEEQFQTLLSHMNPQPVIKIGGYWAGLELQERANKAWEALGNELGFCSMTVEPVRGKGKRFFTADVRGESHNE